MAAPSSKWMGCRSRYRPNRDNTRSKRVDSEGAIGVPDNVSILKIRNQ